MTSLIRCTAITVMFVVLTGCHFLFFGKVKPEPIPTPDPPPPVVITPPPPVVEPPGPPPKIDTTEPEVPSAVAVIPNPPAPKPKKGRPPKKTQTQAAATPPKDPSVPVEAANTPPLANVPKLGEMLTDDQKVQYQRSCDESLNRAKEAMGQLRGVTLSPDQKQSLARVRIFIAQAEQARQRDPQTAKQLAERADLLSRDLVRTVR